MSLTVVGLTVDGPDEFVVLSFPVPAFWFRSFWRWGKAVRELTPLGDVGEDNKIGASLLCGNLVGALLFSTEWQ